MMKMIFKKLLFALLILVSTVASAGQKPTATVIDISDGILKVNGQIIEMPSNIETWNQAIGVDARPIDLGRMAYAWDDYGIRASTDATGMITWFLLFMRELPGNTPMAEDVRLPNKCFPGIFILNGIKLDGALSLDDYNRMAQKHQHQFYEGYLPIVYDLPGYRLPNSDYIYGVSARIDQELRPYNIEIGYSYMPESQSKPDDSNDHNRTGKLIESLRKDGSDLVDRAMKLLDMECEE
jgi:hypothetical protein